MVFTYLLVNTTLVLLQVVYYAMLARVILSFFGVEDGPMMALLAIITEPVAALFRYLLSLFGIGGEGSPIDWGFFVAMFAITFAQFALPAARF
ncbi:MAG: YggT family protein [Clostridia bacterium]|nr:YggT family protein [Clostridia bacterium]MBO7150879.1 YggT family protein [Clostridia bacterium]